MLLQVFTFTEHSPLPLNLFLSLLYFIIGVFLFLRIKWFRQFNFTPVQIVFIFTIKVCWGVIYAWIHQQYYGGGDTFYFFEKSNVLFSSLHQSIWDYVRLVLLPTYNHVPVELKSYAFNCDVYHDSNTYTLLRFMALARLVCGNNYYAVLVIFEWLATIGVLFLLRFFMFYMEQKKLLLVFFIVLFPGIAFWSSGMHKEAITITGLGIALWSFHCLLKQFSVSKSLLFLIGILLIAFSRNFFLLFLIPGLAAWCITNYFPKQAWLKFTVVYCASFVFVFYVLPFISSFNALQLMCSKQLDFIYLNQANANIQVTRLLPTIQSYVHAIPEALSNCLLHPMVSEVFSPIQWPAAFDNVVLFVFALISLMLADFKKLKSPFFILLIMLSLWYYSFIGIIVCNLGALVRYKSVGLLFLFIAFAFIIDQQKLKAMINKIKPSKKDSFSSL